VPIYEYECEGCKNRLEVSQRLSDAALSICPGCGAGLRRLISPSGLMFKGAGWYVTDYARKPETAAKKEGVPAADKKPAESGTPAESKPAESKTPSEAPSTGK